MCFGCKALWAPLNYCCDITVYEMFSAGIYLSIILSPLDMEIVKIVQLVLCLRLEELLFFCSFAEPLKLILSHTSQYDGQCDNFLILLNNRNDV